MSGFEVAGLILGAVPVTIAALEHYKTASEMRHYFTHKSVYIDRLIQAVEEQKFCLESGFDIVLRAAGLDQQDVSVIDVENLQSSLHRSDIAEQLSRYLGRGYDPYQKALLRCESSLREIVKSIDGLVPGSQSGDLKELLRANESKGGKFQFRKRFKFSLKKNELERRISNLIDSTDSLRRLRKTSESLYDNSIQCSSRTITRFAIFLEDIQGHAESLYGALARGLACGCHHEHGAKYYLEGQSAALLKGSLPIKFGLAIEAPERRTAGKLRYEVRIEVLGDDHTKYEYSVLPRLRQRSKRRLQPQRPLKRSRVKFNLPDTPKPPDPRMTVVENLCSSLDQARQDRKALKIFLSSGDLCYRQVPPTPGADFPSSDGTYEMITLEQILQKTSIDGPFRVKWNLIQRMNLSFNLASSLLQLYSTPWLTDSGTKRNIYFWRLGPSSQANDVSLAFETDRPYVVHRFSDASAARVPHKLEARYQLLDLGIILLEIRHQESLESWASARNLTLDRSYGSRYNAASTWLRDSCGDLEPSYFDAAGRCIECTFQIRSAILCWEDLDFRKSICELVVKPLWINCSIDGSFA